MGTDINDRGMSCYGMKLHEERAVAEGVYVLRVPGGWLYKIWSGGVKQVPVFVPHSREFESKPADRPRY